MSQVFYDKCGKRLHEFDVIKVLAYIGPRINDMGMTHIDDWLDNPENGPLDVNRCSVNPLALAMG